MGHVCHNVETPLDVVISWATDTQETLPDVLVAKAAPIPMFTRVRGQSRLFTDRGTNLRQQWFHEVKLFNLVSFTTYSVLYSLLIASLCFRRSLFLSTVAIPTIYCIYFTRASTHTLNFRLHTPHVRAVYKCGSDAEWSALYSFRTLAPFANWAPQVALVGDLGVLGGAQYTVSALQAERASYDVLFHLGDIAYDLHSVCERRSRTEPSVAA